MAAFNFIAVLFITISVKSFCQEKSDFKAILDSKRTGKTYHQASINDTVSRKYLGVIQAPKSKDVCYVITEFRKTRAASTWHGHSTVYFFGPKYEQIGLVHLAMPDNLPYKLENNTLFFKYIKNGITKYYKTSLSIPLPKIFCSREDECDEIELE